MKKISEKVMNELASHQIEGDLIMSSSKNLKMSAQNGSISEYKVSSSQILGIRVIKDGAVGISYTESLDDDSLKLMVKQALQNAQTSEPNPNEKILELSGHLDDEMDVAESEVDIALKTKMALELETAVRAMDPRVTGVPYNGYSENDYKSFYMSSKGRSASYVDKSYSITSSALMDDKGKKAIYYDFNLAHTFNGLQWKKVMESSVFHARNILEAQSLPTGKYQVHFTTDCLKELIGCFSNLYSAKSAMDKMNPWADKLGTEVISKDLTLVDDPLYQDSFRISKFDGEGVERRALSLIENGTLKSLYHNSVTANHFKTKTTGHAVRGPSSSLGVSGTDLILTGKNKKPLPPKYLEIIQMDGLYSGANRVTGSFSVAVKGYVWENGQRTTTFGNITLSGNLMELLKNVEVVGDKLEASTDQSFFSVPLMFHGLSIAGSN